MKPVVQSVAHLHDRIDTAVGSFDIVVLFFDQVDIVLYFTVAVKRLENHLFAVLDDILYHRFETLNHLMKRYIDFIEFIFTLMIQSGSIKYLSIDKVSARNFADDLHYLVDPVDDKPFEEEIDHRQQDGDIDDPEDHGADDEIFQGCFVFIQPQCDIFYFPVIAEVGAYVVCVTLFA